MDGASRRTADAARRKPRRARAAVINKTALPGGACGTNQFLQIHFYRRRTQNAVTQQSAETNAATSRSGRKRGYSGAVAGLPSVRDAAGAKMVQGALREARRRPEDLEQAGFRACKAVETWKPESSAFSTWLTFHLKSAFAAAYRVRTNHELKDPLNDATSLDVPPAGADEDCILRYYSDVAAARAFEAVEQQELADAVHRNPCKACRRI